MMLCVILAATVYVCRYIEYRPTKFEQSVENLIKYRANTEQEKAINARTKGLNRAHQ